MSAVPPALRSMECQIVHIPIENRCIRISVRELVMDQSLVNSGFDVELLIGSRYIAYMLLSFSETGSLPLRVPNGAGFVDIFQPDDVDRLYEPHPDAIPATASSDSFKTELIFGHPTGANVRVDV